MDEDETPARSAIFMRARSADPSMRPWILPAAIPLATLAALAVAAGPAQGYYSYDYKVNGWLHEIEMWQTGITPDDRFVDVLTDMMTSYIGVSDELDASRQRAAQLESEAWASQSRISKLEYDARASQSRIAQLEAYAAESQQYMAQLEASSLASVALLVENERSFGQYVDSVNRYASSVDEYLGTRTVIEDQEINWHVRDSYGNQYSWSMPVETYEYHVRQPEPSDIMTLGNPDVGETYAVIDHRKFIGRNFEEVIGEVYLNAGSDERFVYEVWHIVSQLTTYSYDIGDDPRWALETLSRGGGDCEDTSILIADMLRSSPHTAGWDIGLVYFDAYNPLRPNTMNHVAVYVDYGDGHKTVIESTAKDTPYQWTEGVSGWWFEM